MSLVANVTPKLATRKEWLGLATLTLPTLLVSMDLTVTFLVAPVISEELKPGSAELLWITDIYGFLEASLLITMGTLGDRIGRRKLLMIGGSIFALASVAAAFSQDVYQLIAARALLGMAGASLLPSILSLIRNLFHDRRQRTAALGVFTTTFSAGTMLGPLIGGLLLKQFGWGSVFLIAVPVMLLFIVAGFFLLPEFKDPQPGKFDLKSAGLSVLAVLPVVYGIKRWAEEGTDAAAFICIAAGLLFAFAFIRRQKRLTYPLIDLKLFQSPLFSTTLIAMLFIIFAWAGIFLFIAQQLQLVFGMDAFTAGLWTISGAIGSIVTCSIVPVLVRFFSRVYLLVGGLLLMIAGFTVFYFVDRGLSLAGVVTGIVLVSGGCGMTVTLGHDIIMSSAKPQHAGAVASLTETCTTFGGAMGIALLGSLGTVVYRKSMMGAMGRDMASDDRESVLSTLGNALVAAKEDQVEMIHAAKQAFMHSFSVAAGVSALILVGIVAGLLTRIPVIKKEQSPF